MDRPSDAGMEFARMLVGAISAERGCGALLIDRKVAAIPVNRGGRGIYNGNFSTAT
jgi:hypothetical protein